MTGLAKQFWKPLTGAIVVLAIIGAVLLYGLHRYQEGVEDERVRLSKRAIAAAQSRARTDQDVRGLPDGAAADELRRNWSRD
ncbi:hypothetical protein [Alcaligenes faecalis]|uniref:hypothetical protein n=1 Tax=Alcaligenes faecalis TaxID=511 RepID=UPI0015E7EDA2|nr:hypothetical protein [Alcaligenes faecalis]